MIEVNISCPNVEDRGQVFACDPIAASRGRSPRCAARADPACPVFAKLSPDVTDIVDDRPGLRRRRRRRPLADQHAARHGDRHRHDAPGARRRHRRAVRAGDPAGGGALRLAGARGAAATCRSSAWAASAPAWTRCSSCWPGRPRCRSAPRSSATRPRRCGCCAELEQALDERGFASVADAVGYAHRDRSRRAAACGRTPATPTAAAMSVRRAPGPPRWTSAGRCASASTRTRRCWTRGGCPTTSTGWSGSPRPGRGVRRRGRGGQAAVGVLRDVRLARASPCWSAPSPACREAGALVRAGRQARRHRHRRWPRTREAYLDPASPLAADAITVEPVPRRRLAAAGVRPRRPSTAPACSCSR